MVKTSWQQVEKWYDQSVGTDGHFYHQTVIIPKVMQWLNLKKGDALIDLACGQGVLERQIDACVDYCGIDGSHALIEKAKQRSTCKNHQFITGDITKKINLSQEFSHFTCILALQNVKEQKKALINASSLLKPDGIGVIVINHPILRIPRQTSWQIDENKKLQFRRVDCYLSPLEIPIQHNYQQKNPTKTLSYHFSLTDLFAWLQQANFSVLALEEWVSPKKSTGKKARMENRARSEFPLFMALKIQKRATQ